MATKVTFADVDFSINADDYAPENGDAWAYIAVNNTGTTGQDFYLTYWLQDSNGVTISSISEVVFISAGGTYVANENLPINLQDGELGYYYANVTFDNQTKEAHDVFIVTKRSGLLYWGKTLEQTSSDGCTIFLYLFMLLIIIVNLIYWLWYKKKSEEFKKKYKWVAIALFIILIILALRYIYCWF